MVAVLALPGTFCPPAVFDRLSAELGPEFTVQPWSWLTRPGPWDIPSVAADIAAHHERPLVLLGHSTGGAIALQLTLTHPKLVEALVLVDTGAHMKDHGDVESILRSLRDGVDPQLLAAVLDRSFHAPLEPELREEWLVWAAKVDPQAAHDAWRASMSSTFVRCCPGLLPPRWCCTGSSIGPVLYGMPRSSRPGSVGLGWKFYPRVTRRFTKPLVRWRRRSGGGSAPDPYLHCVKPLSHTARRG